MSHKVNNCERKRVYYHYGTWDPSNRAVLQSNLVLRTKVLLNKLVEERPWRPYETCSSWQRSVQMSTLGLPELLGPLGLWALMLDDFRWKLVLLPSWIFWLIKGILSKSRMVPGVSSESEGAGLARSLGSWIGSTKRPLLPSLPCSGSGIENLKTLLSRVRTIEFLAAFPLQPLEFLTWSWHPISVLLAPNYFLLAQIMISVCNLWLVSYFF